MRKIVISNLLLACGVLALFGFALMEVAGSPVDPLVPAMSALFLGSTQFRDRPNVAGTLLAMLIIATGIKGFQLMGGSAWVTNVFAGSVLLLAVIISHGRVGRVR